MYTYFLGYLRFDSYSYDTFLRSILRESLFVGVLSSRKLLRFTAVTFSRFTAVFTIYVSYIFAIYISYFFMINHHKNKSKRERPIWRDRDCYRDCDRDCDCDRDHDRDFDRDHDRDHDYFPGRLSVY